MNGRIILAIAQKDIRDAIRHRYLLTGLILPVGMSLLFHILFHSASDLGTLQVAIYDPDGSRLTAQLQALPQIKISKVDSMAQLMEQVGKGGAAAGGIAIPSNFDQEIASGRQPELTVYLNTQKGSAQVAVVRQLITEQVWDLQPTSTPAKILWTDIPAAQSSTSVVAVRIDLYLLVLFLVMSLTMTGTFMVPLLLVEEKDKHTMEFLLVSPATPAEVVAGKALTGLAYSAVGAGTMILLNRGWMGDWPVTFLAVFVGALFLVAVGLLMGSVFQTMMQVNTWSSIIMLIILSPTWFTVFQLPAALNTFVQIIPTYYLADLLNRSLSGNLAWSPVATDFGVLLGSLILTFGLVIWILRRQET